eukprot:PhF_6_TR26590/c0_g1_i1/m.38478
MFHILLGGYVDGAIVNYQVSFRTTTFPGWQTLLSVCPKHIPITTPDSPNNTDLYLFSDDENQWCQVHLHAMTSLATPLRNSQFCFVPRGIQPIPIERLPAPTPTPTSYLVSQQQDVLSPRSTHTTEKTLTLGGGRLPQGMIYEIPTLPDEIYTNSRDAAHPIPSTAKVRIVFDRIDTQQRGYISLSEVELFFETVGISNAQEYAKGVFKVVQREYMYYTDFVRVCSIIPSLVSLYDRYHDRLNECRVRDHIMELLRSRGAYQEELSRVIHTMEAVKEEIGKSVAGVDETFMELEQLQHRMVALGDEQMVLIEKEAMVQIRRKQLEALQPRVEMKVK